MAAQAAQTDYPFPNFYQVTDRSTSAQADYQSVQAEFSHRMSRGLSFNTAYTFAKNLSDNQGSAGNFNSAGFVDEQGGYSATDSFDRHLDYGNVAATRRHRWLTSAIYELPIGRGRMFGNKMNSAADALVGGWQISNIFLVQSGPFFTAYFPAGSIDPSGTGSGTYVGGANQRPDRIANANSGARTRDHYFNATAFTCPGSIDPASISSCSVGVGSLPIGRYGNKGARQPFTITLKNGEPMAFAGLWDAWKEPKRSPQEIDTWLQSFSIVTTEANETMAQIHARMPVILPERDWQRWLDRDPEAPPPIDLLRPFDADAMQTACCNPLVGNVRNNGPEMLNSA